MRTTKLSKILFESILDTNASDLQKVFYAFALDLLRGDLEQFKNYGRKLTKKELLELVSTGRVRDYAPDSRTLKEPTLVNLGKLLDNKFQELNDSSKDLEKVLVAVKNAVPVLDSNDEVSKNRFAVLVGKLHQQILNRKELFIDVQKTFASKLPQNFNIKKSQKTLEKFAGSGQEVQLTQLIGDGPATETEIEPDIMYMNIEMLKKILVKLVQEGTYTSLEVLPAYNFLNKQSQRWLGIINQ